MKMDKQKLEQKICIHRRVPLKEECYSCNGIDKDCKDYQPSKTLCKYLEVCLTRKNVRMQNRNINCFKNNAENNCQTYKFYERYGTNPLGIGAVIEPLSVPEELEGEYKL